MKPPINVLVVAHSPHRGGAEYCLDTTLRHLDRSRFDVTVVFPAEGPLSESAREHGYKVLVAPMCHCLYWHQDAWYWKNLLGRSAANILRLRNIIRRERADVVYTNTSAIFESALAARLAAVPHVWHVHEVLHDRNRMHQLLPLRTMKRWIYRLSDRIVFESHAARRVFERSAPSDKSEVIYNSLRLVELATPDSGEQDRARFGLTPDDQVVGFVGQFIDRKNPLMLLRALARVRNVPGLKCLFVGVGALEGALRSEIERLGMSNVCRIVAFQDDVAPVMRAIDALVLPSRQESFGLVLVEAASYGKPAIACRSEGPNEIVADGETGFLVAQDDELALAAAIERMLLADAERLAMGKAAVRRADRLFSATANTRQLENLFCSVLRGRVPKTAVEESAVA